MKSIVDFIQESSNNDYFECDSYFDFKAKFFKRLVKDGYLTQDQAKKFEKDDPFYTDGGEFVDAKTSKTIKGVNVPDDGVYADVYNALVKHFIDSGIIKKK